jgi:bromodomain-containing protein 7/9
MNRFQKFKQSSYSTNANFLTEDSNSDCISSSDIETSSSKPNADNHHAASNMDAADSNDSFMYDRDNNSNSIHTSEPKTTTTTTTTTNTLGRVRLAECLDHLHRLICRKDKEDIFGLPVTDAIAPGYSLIIKTPMDLSTMKAKIDSHAYSSVMEYRDDIILMCENCMTYNKIDTIYHGAARKLFDYCLKFLSRDKLLSLRHTVRAMRVLTSAELGFSIDGGESSESLYAHNIASKQRAIVVVADTPQVTPSFSSMVHSKSSKVFANRNFNFRLDDSKPLKESYLVPPEGEPDDNLEDEYANAIHQEVLQLADNAAKRLAVKNEHGQIGFLRRNSNGTTGYNFLKHSSPLESKNPYEKQDGLEKPVTIGNLSEGLQPSSFSMSSFLEEKKNKTKPMHYVENGPFTSNAPVYDSSYSSLPKDELDILLTTYGDDTAYQYALSLIEFSKGTGYMFNRYVNLVLNTLSNNEHEKYLQYKQSQTAKDSSMSAINTQPAIKQEKPNI